MADQNPFLFLEVEALDKTAQEQGFQRKGQRNWVRRTTDFVQLINLQKSQWSPEHRYLNFALWPLSLGEPPTIAESKFHFRTRAESMGATDLCSFFSAAGKLSTLAELRAASRSGRVSGLTTKELLRLMA